MILLFLGLSFNIWQRVQQQVHDRHRVPAGGHLLHLHHGAPPLQHGHQYTTAGSGARKKYCILIEQSAKAPLALAEIAISYKFFLLYFFLLYFFIVYFSYIWTYIHAKLRKKHGHRRGLPHCFFTVCHFKTSLFLNKKNLFIGVLPKRTRDTN